MFPNPQNSAQFFSVKVIKQIGYIPFLLASRLIVLVARTRYLWVWYRTLYSTRLRQRCACWFWLWKYEGSGLPTSWRSRRPVSTASTSTGPHWSQEHQSDCSSTRVREMLAFPWRHRATGSSGERRSGIAAHAWASRYHREWCPGGSVCFWR